MSEEPYEILPYREVATLKKDIADIKQKLGDSPSKQLMESIANLSKTMDHMLNLFQTAAGEMKSDEGRENPSDSGILDEINRKLDELIDQNKTIAEGIVAVADMIKGETAEEEIGQEIQPIGAPRFGPQPFQQQRPAPSFGQTMPRPMDIAEPIPTPLGPFPLGPLPGPNPEKQRKRFF